MNGSHFPSGTNIVASTDSFFLSNGHPTERISQFVDYYLKPLVHKTVSFIKDTTHFLNKLDQRG